MRDGFDTFCAVMMIFCALMILFCFYGCTMSIKQANEFRERCEARGGVYHPIYKSQDLCLRRDDVVPMDEPEEEPEGVNYKPRFTGRH